MYIDVPATPLPKRLKIGNYQATIFHYEQRHSLASGHHAGAPECSSVPLGTATTIIEQGQGVEESSPVQPVPIQPSLHPPPQQSSSTPTPPSHPNPNYHDNPPQKQSETSVTASEKGKTKMKQTTIQLLDANENQLATLRENKSNEQLQRIERSNRGRCTEGRLLEARRPSMPGEETMSVL